MEKSTVGIKMTRPGWYSMTPLSVRSSYDSEKRAHSSRVLELSDVAKNSPIVTSERQHGAASDNTWNFPNIAVSEFYFWHTTTADPNLREAPNLEHMVRGIHTVDGGSCPLPLSYAFCASVSDYSWWSIIDGLLFHTCHDLMSSVLQPLLPYKTVPINKLG